MGEQDSRTVCQPARGAYTVGWLVSVLSLYAAHELDGHWIGVVIVLAAYGVGLTYVHRRCRHG
jgi:hypothetical protein